jgi:hypothetical protein
MNSDLNSFYNQLQNNLAPYATSIGSVLIAVSFLQAVSIFFLLIVINKYSGEDKPVQENNANIAKMA